MKNLLSIVIAVEVLALTTMPNDVNRREYSVSEGNATLTSRVQTEDCNHTKTAGTHKRIA